MPPVVIHLNEQVRPLRNINPIFLPKTSSKSIIAFFCVCVFLSPKFHLIAFHLPFHLIEIYIFLGNHGNNITDYDSKRQKKKNVICENAKSFLFINLFLARY